MCTCSHGTISIPGNLNGDKVAGIVITDIILGVVDFHDIVLIESRGLECNWCKCNLAGTVILCCGNDSIVAIYNLECKLFVFEFLIL